MRRPIIGEVVWFRDYEDDVVEEGGVPPKPSFAWVADVREDNSVRVAAWIDRNPPIRNIPYWIPYSEEPKGNTWGWPVRGPDSRPTDAYDVVTWAARLALLRARDQTSGGEDAGARALREFAEELVFQWEEWQPETLGPLPPLRVRRRTRV